MRLRRSRRRMGRMKKTDLRGQRRSHMKKKTEVGTYLRHRT
jgi:hypothetical protein